ncbi:unnamed protein product [Scytosiphon promiscuus]
MLAGLSSLPENIEYVFPFSLSAPPLERFVHSLRNTGNPWLPSLFCKMCIEVLIKRQWSIYEDGLAKATCKAQQKRMLGDGPPTHVNDKKALSCGEGESVHSLWFVREEGGEPEIQSAELEGAPQGEARQIWWDEKLAFQFDEDDEEEEGEEAGGGKTTPAAGPTASTPPPAPNTAADPPASTAASPPPVPTATAAAAGAADADAGSAEQRREGEGSVAVTEGSPEAASGEEAVAAGPKGPQTGVPPPKMPTEEIDPTPAPAPPVTADTPATPSVPLA